MAVKVTGPDGKNYEFPDGTTKESAVAYFKKKGIGLPSASPSGLSVGARPPKGAGTDPRGERTPNALDRFSTGLGQGVNPLHTAPANMAPSPAFNPTSAAGKFGADMINLRETSSKAASGDTAGAIGMGIGTTLGMVGPHALRGAGLAAKEAGVAARATKDVGMLSKTAKRGKETATALGGGVEGARFAEQYVAPLREALDRKFAPLHKALANKAFALSGSAQQLINRLHQSEVPAVKKFASDLMRNTGGTLNPRTALDYQEARKLAEGTIQNMISQVKKLRADHWAPELEALRDEIETGIDGLAKSARKGALRDNLKKTYGEVQALKNAIIVTAKQPGSLLKALGGAGSGAAAGAAIGHPYVGMMLGAKAAAGKALKISPEVKAEAARIAKKLGIDPKVLLGPMKNTMEKAGEAAIVGGTAGGAAEGIGRAIRGGAGAMGPTPASAPPPQSQP